MYLRFLSVRKNEDCHAWLGIVHLAYIVRDRAGVQDHNQETLQLALWWLGEYLPVPDCFDECGSHRGLCWLRPSAREVLECMWTLTCALRDEGEVVHFVKCPSPGRLLYEDEYQVVARPWQRDRRRF